MEIRSKRGASAVQRLFTAFLFIFALAFSASLYAADDDEAFLNAIAEEVEKIRDTEDVDTESGTAAAAETTDSVDAQRDEFESYLKAKHRGTYAFYRKLPDHSREEIFKSFVDGASMKDIRHMVINRSMNR